MPLGLVELQQRAHLRIKLRADSLQPLGNILMYGGLGDAELFGGGPDCRAVFGNVLREPDGALLDVSPHLHHSRKVVAYYMSRAARLIPDRLSQGSTEVFAKFAKLMAFIQLLFVKMYVILQTI